MSRKYWSMKILIVLAATSCAARKFSSDTRSPANSVGSIVSKNVFDQTPLDLSKVAVNEDTKNAGGPTGGQTGQVERSLDMTCEESLEKTLKVSSKADADLQIKNDNKVVMNIKGRFCPTVSNNLTVLFIIDYSGSMGPHIDPTLGLGDKVLPGNDPMSGNAASGNCGRLEAVEAVMGKFKANDNVFVGNVAFAGGIVDSYSTAPVGSELFKSRRLAANKAKNFCAYVGQSSAIANPAMAIPAATVDARTNYEAAFNRAYEYLKNVKGRKVIYFITDGRPTASSGFDPFADGKRAASKLKSLENLYVNAFFLEFKQSGGPSDNSGYDKLVETIGNRANVVRVDSASNLATEVSKDVAASFDPASIKASLTIPPYKPEANLKITSFIRDPQNAKAFVFETEPFVLLGNADRVYDHQIRITAKSTDGVNHSSKVNILYQKTTP